MGTYCGWRPRLPTREVLPFLADAALVLPCSGSSLLVARVGSSSCSALFACCSFSAAHDGVWNRTEKT